jgi:hypothetical protein
MDRRRADEMEGFEFVDKGATFTCWIAAPAVTRTEAWWWFRVARTDEQRADRHRYAPFRATAHDTRGSVQSAIVAFYDDLLARRALPLTSYWGRGAAGRGAGASGGGSAGGTRP